MQSNPCYIYITSTYVREFKNLSRRRNHEFKKRLARTIMWLVLFAVNLHFFFPQHLHYCKNAQQRRGLESMNISYELRGSTHYN